MTILKMIDCLSRNILINQNMEQAGHKSRLFDLGDSVDSIYLDGW